LVDFDSAHAQLVLQAFLGALLACMFGGALAVVAFFAWRVARPTVRYSAFLCHHKASAGALARLFKIVYSSRVQGEIFIDSDHLDSLESLFAIVAFEVRNFVVIWTKETLTRIWCAGEITAAVRRGVHTVPVACSGHQLPTDADLAALKDVWSAGELAQLAALGIELPHIHAAYKVFRGVLRLSFERGAAPERQKEAIFESLGLCRGLRVKVSAIGRRQVSVADAEPPRGSNTVGFRPSRSSSSHTSSVKLSASVGLVILGNLNDPEAVSTCQVLQLLLAQATGAHVLVLEDVLEGNACRTTTVVAVLTRGVLQNPTFAASLCSAQAQGLGVVPVNCDSEFCFPAEAFWEALQGGRILDPADPNLAELSVKAVEAAYRMMFQDIAKVFSVRSSQRILDAQIKDMHRAFKAVSCRRTCTAPSRPSVRSSQRILDAQQDHAAGEVRSGWSLRLEAGAERQLPAEEAAAKDAMRPIEHV